MFDANDVHQRPDILSVLAWRVCEMRPYSDCAAVVCDHFSLLFADEPGPHHFCHVRVASEAGVESRVRNHHWAAGDRQRHLRGLNVGVSKDRILSIAQNDCIP